MFMSGYCWTSIQFWLPLWWLNARTLQHTGVQALGRPLLWIPGAEEPGCVDSLEAPVIWTELMPSSFPSSMKWPEVKIWCCPQRYEVLKEKWVISRDLRTYSVRTLTLASPLTLFSPMPFRSGVLASSHPSITFFTLCHVPMEQSRGAPSHCSWGEGQQPKCGLNHFPHPEHH